MTLAVTTQQLLAGPVHIVDGNSQVIQLQGDQYMHLPVALSSNIDTLQNFSFRIRFKVTDQHTVNPFNGITGEGVRVLVSNRGQIQYFLGFDLFMEADGVEQILYASYGDGTGLTDGKLDNVGVINVGDWNDVEVKMVFDSNTPHVQYIVNNFVKTSYFHEDEVNLSIFKTSLDQQQNMGRNR